MLDPSRRHETRWMFGGAQNHQPLPTEELRSSDALALKGQSLDLLDAGLPAGFQTWQLPWQWMRPSIDSWDGMKPVAPCDSMYQNKQPETEGLMVWITLW
jgi:hypothetical protein